ncbi:unnamed protein product [Cochlearia groenlandica]
MEGSSETNSRGLNPYGFLRNITRDSSKSLSHVSYVRSLLGSNKDDDLRLLDDDTIVRALGCEGGVSLRQWLDNHDRTVDAFECFHVFRQIVEFVNVAHSQGIVVHNVRPSCFVVSSFNNRVSFIESDEESTTTKSLAMEITWYTSPEEDIGSSSTSSSSSDVYRLGVLLFEVC